MWTLPHPVPSLWLAALAVPILGGGCDDRSSPKIAPPTAAPAPKRPSLAKPPDIVSPAGIAKPPYQFSPEDAAFLDQVQRGCFNFFWHAWPGPVGGGGMVPDRASNPSVVSVAGVGFQLSAFVVGAERGWVTKDQAAARALAILQQLEAAPDNRKSGLFYHFIDGTTGGVAPGGYEHVVSTIDSALLFAGIISASSYFGGEVRAVGDRLVAAADWKFFTPSGPQGAGDGGGGGGGGGGVGDSSFPDMVCLGWKPADKSQPTGAGSLLNYQWLDCGDEHRLVTFLAVAAPEASHAIAPEVYYRLRRQVGEHADTGPMVWFPWSGALFVSFFAHCWIDYSAMGPDDPGALGQASRPRVDWWENARRTVRLHQIKAAENPRKLAGFGENGWGLSASDVKAGYAVPGVFPDALTVQGWLPQFDFAVPGLPVKDDFGDGTLAPYAAGSAIMFDPARAVAALRNYREVRGPDGTPLVWQDPGTNNGFGFRDAYNAGAGWVSQDFVSIDQGPLILAIENARSGLLWRTFGAHPVVRAGYERLGLKPPAR